MEDLLLFQIQSNCEIQDCFLLFLLASSLGNVHGKSLNFLLPVMYIDSSMMPVLTCLSLLGILNADEHPFLPTTMSMWSIRLVD